ncbi:oxygen-insensitive NADPH nitroreductase [Paenisporosarcina antarctica]|uniref:Oxygen-insensitive NADPH nitroreductase n=1 Tax=Paenisporosarcina antarctica TaxID=417367 RepID=A0A4P7A1X2_9BACL|nr:oxygen-insensitive NADPH nitroreductase [Paenisporosarcina antarctica]QBP41916.1 oxygen-insensitive NADPH nitroreductase [Paenisporosarcina antarctica]
MVIELIRSHSSVRSYTEKQLSREEVSELVEIAQHAATSHFVQAYSVVWVTDKEKREKLAELSRNPKQMLGAGAVLLLCADFSRLSHAGKMHGESIVFDNAESLIVGITDVGLFAQNLALAAESKGYGICYIGGVRNEMEAISDLVELPNGVFPVYGMTMGVPAEHNEVKPRLPVDAILHENKYDEVKYDELLPTYDKEIERYYKNRSTNEKSTTWTKGMAVYLKKPQRLHVRSFLEKKGFHLK